MAEMATHVNNRTQPRAVTSDDERTSQPHLNVSQILAPYVSKLDAYDRQSSNFSKRMTQQTKSLQSLERQHKRLRRMLAQIEQNMRTVEAAQRNASDVKALMTQFADKQTDINSRILATVAYVEEQKLHLVQNDSPLTVTGK